MAFVIRQLLDGGLAHDDVLTVAGAGHCQHVVVGEASVQELADDEGHAAGGLEGVHVLVAVGIDPRDQRHRLGDLLEVLPGDLHARGAGHGDEVQGVVGRAAGGHQAGHGVDHALLVHHVGHRRVGVAVGADLDAAPGGGGHQRLAQGRVGMHEGRARQVQAHHLHHHLVGVGGAVEGAGAGAVVGLRL